MKDNFTITITDNRTGEILLDRDDVVAYIGGVAFKEDGESIGGAYTNPIRIAETINYTEEAITQVKKSSPTAAALVALVALYAEDTEETQEEK